MNQRGFTLIELMVTVSILAILGSIALPSYQEYVRRQRLAVAKQEMMVIAGELERFKSKNFSYTGFNDRQISHIYGSSFSNNTLKVPTDPKKSKQYDVRLTILDGYRWHMVATKVDTRNYNAYINSQGLRCQTKDAIKPADAQPCGSNSETW